MPTLSEKLAVYYCNARWRAQRRKSAWNILLIALSFAAWVAIWHALFWLVWAFHVAIYPQHQLADFWPRGISTRSFALSFLMVFALAPAAMTLGFMLGNALLWLLPPPRRTLDAESQGYPGTSFTKSMRGLGKICLWALPIGLAVSLIAAYFLNSL